MNSDGQLGRETSSDRDSTFTQVTVGNGVKIKAIAAGASHTVLLDANGNVWTAGSNYNGQLGRETSSDKDSIFTQVTVGDGVKIKAIAAGQQHTVLLNEDGNVWTAGLNDYGQLGRTDSNTSTFTQVTGGISGVKIKAIAAGFRHTVLLDESNNVWTAGFNYYGQLGRDENAGTYTANPTFTQSPVNPDAITFDEFVNIPIHNNSVFLVKFKDVQKPVITGLESNKTYCDTVEFEVSDNDGVASVTANDVELTATDGKYTLEKGKGTVTVVAKDNAGNEASLTVTVNDGHTDINKDHACDYCDANVGAHEDTNSDHNCDYGCNVEIGVHEDTNSDHKCDYGCSEAIGIHEDTNRDHKCDYGCSEAIGIHADTNRDHKCDYCGEEMTTCLDDDKDHLCDICGLTLSDHTGGTATCITKAVCDYCSNEYGELDSSNHNLEKISAKDATVTETGNTEYWHCTDCGKYFTDENGTDEITLDDTVISKLPPEIIEGKGQSVTEGESKELTFKSNAAFSDFIRVELDGKTLDAENYTATEGSTIVTLKADYVATLSAGEHTIGIVSESGTATTTFTVNAKSIVNNDTKSPETGNDEYALYFAMLFALCGAGIITTSVYSKRKKRSR